MLAGGRSIQLYGGSDNRLRQLNVPSYGGFRRVINRNSLTDNGMRAKPHGGKVGCSSTRFPTRARLRKSLFSVAGFRPLAENTDRLEALNVSFALLSPIEHGDSSIAERMLPVLQPVQAIAFDFSGSPAASSPIWSRLTPAVSM